MTAGRLRHALESCRFLTPRPARYARAAHAPQSFDDGSKVILDNDWLIQANSKNYHHFFPRSRIKKHWPDWDSNNVANITIVDDRLNKHVIRDKSPSAYLKKFGGPKDPKLAARLKTHLINPDRDGVWDDDYERFIDRRCAAIAKELNKRLIPQPDQPEGRRGEPHPGRDASEAATIIREDNGGAGRDVFAGNNFGTGTFVFNGGGGRDSLSIRPDVGYHVVFNL